MISPVPPATPADGPRLPGGRTQGAGWMQVLSIFLIVGLGWFSAPAVPATLDDWPALRAEMFFQGLATAHPAQPGDGPLALLLQPMFGRGYALAHIVWEFSAAIFVALIAALALPTLPRPARWGGVLALIVLSSLWREAGWWVAAGVALTLLRHTEARPYPLLVGVALGLFALLSFPFFLLGPLAALVFLPHPQERSRAAALLVAWAGTLVTGWSIAHGSAADFLHFLQSGSTTLPGWTAFGALLLCGLVFLSARAKSPWTPWVCAAAGAILSLPQTNISPASFAEKIITAPARASMAWSVLAHPVRFEKRVLTPAWQKLRGGHELPLIRRELEEGIVDVIGAPPLLALVNDLRHRPGSARTKLRGLLVPANASASAAPRGFRFLFEENGIGLHLPPAHRPGGFSPWPQWPATKPIYSPVLIESPARPEIIENEGHPAASYALPLRLGYGPLPFASERVEGRFTWEGGAGRLRVSLRQADGTTLLLLEQGLNPALVPAQRGEQRFLVDLPDLPDASLELAATTDAPGDPTARFQLHDLHYQRDANRMIFTDLSPLPLHEQAGFQVFPATVFSLTEAAPMVEADGTGKLMIHLPANLVIGKVREATRLTGTFGFLSGAYERSDAGTNGAVFTIVWISGTDRVEQIFSRTLRPRTEPADRGPQSFDLDVSALSDGLLHFSFNPAVTGDNSFGWTYVGGLDLQTTDHRPGPERFAELFDAYRVNFRPTPSLIRTNEQRPQLITAAGQRLIRIHAPGEIVVPVTAGNIEAIGKFGFADEAWETAGLTDGADYVVLWRDYRGDQELFRRHLAPQTRPADRGVHEFKVSLLDRGSGFLVLRTEPGPAKNNFWDWTGWSDVSVR